MKFYLDHNIYLYSLDNESICQAVEKLKADSVEFLYSPAHIEEIYSAYIKDEEQYQEKVQKIFAQISKFTNNMECFPSNNEIIIKEEKPTECYKRVSGIDTTKRIESDGKYNHQLNKTYYKELCKKDRHFQSISLLKPNEIWECEEIIRVLNRLNKNMSKVIKKHNCSCETFFLRLVGIDKSLPENLQIYRGMYSELEKSHKVLEYVVEQLFILLNMVGYNADKKEKTNISGIHDISHAIYATKADKLFSTDKKFVNKCKAIYYFLGIETEVILCTPEEISKILLEANSFNK